MAETAVISLKASGEAQRELSILRECCRDK